MAVQVTHALSGVGSLIDDKPVSGATEAQLFGDFARSVEDMPKKSGIIGRRIVHPVHRSLNQYSLNKDSVNWLSV